MRDDDHGADEPVDEPVDVTIAILDGTTIALQFSEEVGEVKMNPREARLLGMQLRAAANELEQPDEPS